MSWSARIGRSTRYASLNDVPAHLLVEAAHGMPEQHKVLKRAKYGNRAVVIDGKRFDSKLEGRCYQELNLLWKSGQILWFVRQVKFELPGGVVYRADFLVVSKDGVEVIDATGFMTSVKANKLKQVKAAYGIEVAIWRGK